MLRMNKNCSRAFTAERRARERPHRSAHRPEVRCGAPVARRARRVKAFAMTPRATPRCGAGSRVPRSRCTRAGGHEPYGDGWRTLADASLVVSVVNPRSSRLCAQLSDPHQNDPTDARLMRSSVRRSSAACASAAEVRALQASCAARRARGMRTQERNSSPHRREVRDSITHGSHSRSGDEAVGRTPR